MANDSINVKRLGEIAQGMSLCMWRRDFVPEPWALYYLEVNKGEAEPAEGKIWEKF